MHLIYLTGKTLGLHSPPHPNPARQASNDGQMPVDCQIVVYFACSIALKW